MTNNTAYLSNNGDIVCFNYSGRIIRFRGPYSLVCFDYVKEWDNGYIEVMTRFSHTEELIEEYIDLVPILKNLYIDSEKFLGNIEKVWSEMFEKEIISIADNADMIINGFSFTANEDGFIRVLNLNNPEEACLLNFL